jgi:hypothetical protein
MRWRLLGIKCRVKRVSKPGMISSQRSIDDFLGSSILKPIRRTAAMILCSKPVSLGILLLGDKPNGVPTRSSVTEATAEIPSACS